MADFNIGSNLKVSVDDDSIFKIGLMQAIVLIVAFLLKVIFERIK